MNKLNLCHFVEYSILGMLGTLCGKNTQRLKFFFIKHNSTNVTIETSTEHLKLNAINTPTILKYKYQKLN